MWDLGVLSVRSLLSDVEALAFGLPAWFQNADGDFAIRSRVVLILGWEQSQFLKYLDDAPARESFGFCQLSFVGESESDDEEAFFI